MFVSGPQPHVHGTHVDRMSKMQGYQRCAAADNVAVFHGREVRQVTQQEWRKHAAILQPLRRAVTGLLFTLTLEAAQVTAASGGMGFVLHLSLANAADAEGWTEQEMSEYDGWGHDSSRRWRKASQLQKERSLIWCFYCAALTSNTGRVFSFLVQVRAGSVRRRLLLQNSRRNFNICNRYTLHHRFYFHTDSNSMLWLAAEDGCEGVGPKLQQGEQ
jgi:hypothetical protein